MTIRFTPHQRSLLVCDEGARYEAFVGALRRAAPERTIPLAPCGGNADWIGETYHLSGGTTNQTPGDYYITDNEDDSWSLVRRFYIDYENAPAQDGATYAGDGYNDELRDVLTIELLERANDLPGAASTLLDAFQRQGTPPCEGCENLRVATRPYIVVRHDDTTEHARYCLDCAGLAGVDWNGTTKTLWPHDTDTTQEGT